MKKKVFLSGTEETTHILDVLYSQIQSFGYIPIWYKKDFPINTSDALDDCFKNVQEAERFILVIGKHYGDRYAKTNRSITSEEFNIAYDNNKPILIFIRIEIYEEYKIYRRFKQNNSKKLQSKFKELFTADQEVLEFIDTIHNMKNKGEHKVPWISHFKFVSDIMKTIEEKWGKWIKSKEKDEIAIKMNTFKLIPQLRDNCIIQGKKEWLSEFEVGDTIFLISNLPTKKFSIISKIDGIEYSEEPKIFIDKRILGNFGENDEVFILKYNPAEALEVRLSISEEYTLIYKGDWTSNIKPSLMNKLLDIGQEVPFLLSWEVGAPIVATGLVNSTMPNTPVYIGNRTRIFLDKNSNDELSAIKRENLVKQEERVEILETQIRQNIIEIVKDVKHGNYPNKGQKYKFYATNPKQLFKSILDLFKGLDCIEEPYEQVFDDEEQDYLASAVFLIKSEQHSVQLVDIQIIASRYTGTFILWVTGKTENKILGTLKRLDLKISDLRQCLEQKVEVISASCPECGGDLPIKNIDVNGIVECIHCKTISKIPKALRY